MGRGVMPEGVAAGCRVPHAQVGGSRAAPDERCVRGSPGPPSVSFTFTKRIEKFLPPWALPQLASS